MAGMRSRTIRWLAAPALAGLVAVAGMPLLRARPSAGFETQTKDIPAKPLKLPAGWNPRDPLPLEKSNCMVCHLTAGRELTTPVRDFARSVHDRARLSCND